MNERVMIQRHAFRMAMVDAASYAVRMAAATAIDDGIRKRLEAMEAELDSICDECAGIANMLVEGERTVEPSKKIPVVFTLDVSEGYLDIQAVMPTPQARVGPYAIAKYDHADWEWLKAEMLRSIDETDKAISEILERGFRMTLYKCPSCQRSVWRIGSTDLYSCECGMVFCAVTSDIHYAYGDDAGRDEIRKVLESTLTVFKTKREEVNEMREHQKRLAVEYLLAEVMKGPIEGGTMADCSSACSTFGSDVWNALEKAILIRDPMCRICGQRESREVHHIRPRHLKGKDHPRNLIGLCLECHDEVHRRIDRGIQDVLESSLGIRIMPMRNQPDLTSFGADGEGGAE